MFTFYTAYLLLDSDTFTTAFASRFMWSSSTNFQFKSLTLKTFGWFLKTDWNLYFALLIQNSCFLLLLPSVPSFFQFKAFLLGFKLKLSVDMVLISDRWTGSKNFLLSAVYGCHWVALTWTKMDIDDKASHRER